MCGSLITVMLFILSIKTGIGIPTTRYRLCSSTEPMIFRHGDTLKLECGSYCSTPDDSSLQFKWSKKVLVGGSTIELGLKTGPLFSIENALFRDSGEYTCQCVEGGQQCSYNVSVLPKMTFEASEKFVSPGDTFDLTCTITGYPSNFSRITSKQSGEELPYSMPKRLDEATTQTYVPVFVPVGDVYVCEAESYFGGELVAQLREEITVLVYDPPSIIYTTEFIISNKEGFGKSGHLICTVQKSPDTTTSVSWFNKGEEITNTSKYTTNKEMEDENIVKYQLVVSDLQESDIGSYLCRLSSSYGIEDMQEAWIQVDYRKDTNAINEHGSSHAHENEDQAFGGPTSGQNSALFFGLCGCAVLVAMVILWRMSTGKGPKPHKKRMPSPAHIRHEHGNEDAVTTTSHTQNASNKLNRKYC